MGNVLMMIQAGCPFCKQALAIMEELKAENPAYAGVPIQVVDELREPAFADSLDYYYVPTYFVDGEKKLEGVPTKETVRAVYEAALGK